MKLYTLIAIIFNLFKYSLTRKSRTISCLDFSLGLRGRTNLTDENIFFVTTTIVGFTKVFVKVIYCKILVKNILHHHIKFKFKILAYVIMPSHLYWIVIVHKNFGTISDIMRDIKKYSAWEIMDGIIKNDKDLMSVFIEAGKKYPNHKQKLWMQRFDDEVIRNEKMYWTKLHYIHNNPVEAGLVNKPECYKFLVRKIMFMQIILF